MTESGCLLDYCSVSICCWVCGPFLVALAGAVGEEEATVVTGFLAGGTSLLSRLIMLGWLEVL